MARKRKPVKRKGVRKRRKKTVTFARKEIFGNLEYWRKEITLAGFFLVAVGLIWFLSENGVLSLPTAVLPLIVIILGFVMALAGTKE